MSKKRFMKRGNQALEQIVNKQQIEIENLRLQLTTDNDFWASVFEEKQNIINAQDKVNAHNVLMCIFLVDILLLIGQLEKVLADNTTLTNAVKLAITKFKMELSRAMRTIQYDGADGYTFAPSINEDNDNVDVNEDEEEN